MSYRFRQTEIEDMKEAISKDFAKYGNTMRLGCFWRKLPTKSGKVWRAKCERWLALYEMLTVNDMPNF